MEKDDIKQILEVQESQNTNILSENNLIYALENDSTNYFIVAKDENLVVGFAGITYVEDSCDLVAIVVRKDYTNNGIGSSLLNNIIKYCENNTCIKKIMLEARRSNKIAIELYERFGFSMTFVRHNYYDNNEDALIYSKEL